MADEELGSLGVSITGDYSDLQDAINEATAAATKGAQQITDAINTSGAASEKATEQFTQMAESLAGIGEALVITEGLREFGEEALTTAGTVQSVQIALTQMTGSAEQAATAIDDIKQLAATEPFAFPDIAPAIQKMVALGVSMEQLPGVMQAVADSAAATGNAFNSAAQSFDRIASSGTVSARSLVQLGLSTADLGRAMGITADQVTTAFKALDETQRIDVLTTALEKFAGSAEAQAQGIAGQWQIFQNQFEEVMVSVGEALTPAVSSILSFGKSVLSTVQEVTDAFNSLPEPVKQIAGELGIAGAAVGTLALGVSSLIGLMTPLVGLLKSAATAATEDAVATEADAQAHRSLAAAESLSGEAGAAASAGIGASGLAGASAQLAVSARQAEGPLTEMGSAIEGLGSGAAEGAGGLVLVEQAATGVGESSALAAEGFSALGIGVGQLAIVAAGPVIASLVALQANLGNLKEKYDELSRDIVSNSIVNALNAGNTVKDLQTIGFTVDQLKTAIGGMGLAGASVSQQLAQSLQPPLQAFQNLGGNVTDLQTKLKSLAADGIPVFQALATSPDFQTFISNLQTLGVNVDEVKKKIDSLVPSLQNVGAASQDLSSSIGLIVVATTSSSAALATATQSQIKLNAATVQAKQVMTDAYTALSKLTPGTKDYSVAAQVAATETQNFYKAEQASSGGADKLADSIFGIQQKLQQAQTSFQSSVAALQQIERTAPNTAAGVSLIADAFTKAAANAAKAKQPFADAVGFMAQQSVANKQAQASLKQYSDAIDAYLKQLADGNLTADQTVQVTQDIATTYGLAQKAADATGTSYYNSAAATIVATNAANQQVTGLRNATASYDTLAQSGVKNIATQQALASEFSTVQKDAAALGLSVQQIGNALVFTVANTQTATKAQQDLAEQLTVASSNGTDLVTINGKLVATLKSVQDAARASGGEIKNFGTAIVFNQQAIGGSVQIIQELAKGMNDSGSAFGGAIQAVQQHANALSVWVHSAVDAASAAANVTIATKNFQIAANSTVQSLQNAIDAFNNLNATTAKTAPEQIALQNAFDSVQAAAKAAGLQVQFVGNQLVVATTAATSADPKFQQLAADMNKVAQAAQGAANQVKDAAKQVTSMEDDIKSFDSILGRGPSASIGEGGIAGTTVNGPGGVSVTIPIPTDPDPGNDYWSPQAQAWLSIPKGYVPLPGTHTDAPVGTANNPTPTAGGSTSSSGSSSSSGFVAFGLAVGAATTAVSGVTTAATAVATPLGDFASIIPGATTATRQFTTGLLSTTHTAKDYETATEIASGATNSYAQAVSDAANASAAYSNAVSQGTDSGTISGLYTAMQEAQVAVDDMRGQTRLVTDASQALASTTGTYSDDLAAAMNAVKGQTTTYDQAVQSLTSATNAYGQALATGTATQDQLNSLKAAQVVAAQQVNDQTGVSRGPDSSNPQITVSGTPTPVQIVSVAGRTPGITNFTVDNPAYTTPSNPDYGSPYTSSQPGQISIPMTFTTGTVVGANGMQQLSDMIMTKVVTALRQAGVKL